MLAASTAAHWVAARVLQKVCLRAENSAALTAVHSAGKMVEKMDHKKAVLKVVS